jgi:hypothetical protein
VDAVRLFTLPRPGGLGEQLGGGPARHPPAPLLAGLGGRELPGHGEGVPRLGHRPELERHRVRERRVHVRDSRHHPASLVGEVGVGGAADEDVLREGRESREGVCVQRPVELPGREEVLRFVDTGEPFHDADVSQELRRVEHVLDRGSEGTRREAVRTGQRGELLRAPGESQRQRESRTS